MKLGRNAPCPCGSGKKYKRCCMDKVAKKTVYLNPTFTGSDLNAVLQRRIKEQKSQPNEKYCGLSQAQITNWLSAPFREVQGVVMTAPEDASMSPVMRYLEVILEEAMSQGGSFKVTAKGNLPVKVVKSAQALLPEFAVAKYEQDPSISEFSGSNEDRFNALHYTRVLAELAGIIELSGGRIHITPAAQQAYQAHGLRMFFIPMLEAVASKYDWGYFDSLAEVELRKYWLFMLWRIQSHGSIEQLIEEMRVAFASEFSAEQATLVSCITSRFVERFLQFWGFVTYDKSTPSVVELQPLLEKVFKFSM